MLNYAQQSSVPAGLPNQSNSTSPGSSGNVNALAAQTYPPWSGVLAPTALSNDGAATIIHFPSITFKEQQSNSLAIHTYPNLDSARIENMGRNPAKFVVKAILTNDIYPGADELWLPGTLFPQVFNGLLNVLLDTTTDKVFSHPYYGAIVVQVESWSYDFEAKGPRDGVIVDMVLVETIGFTNITTSSLPAPPGSGITSAANALDAVIYYAEGSLITPQFTSGISFGLSLGIGGLGFSTSINIPGIDLSGFFPSIAVQIQSSLAYPNSVIPALNSDIFSIQTDSSVSGSIAATPAYITYNTLSNMQAFKGPVLGSTVYNANSPFYDQSTYNAMQALVALNYQPSQNSSQLINKAMTVCITLQQHYLNQDNPLASPIIEQIRQFLLQLQQTYSAISFNTNNQALSVNTYVTPTTATWMQLSNYLHNSIDDLMTLNEGLISALYVPAFTTINYYQS